MCLASTGRRRSISVLPNHLLASTTAKTTSSTEPSLAPPETRSMSSQQQPAKAKKSKKKRGSSTAVKHHTPHHDGLAIQHHYHDHAADPTIDPSLVKHKAKGGVIVPFPVKLHDMLQQIENDGHAHVVSWQPHGRCFAVHKPKEFVNHVMPHYFKQTKMASFQRQLNLYGFNRLTGGLDKGGYYHELFLRGKVSLAYDIHRMRVKGTGVRLPTNPDAEPNFYLLPPVTKDIVAMTTVSSMPPPLPDVPMSSMTTRQRAAKQQRRESDVVLFEGLPFHYLDPRALPSTKPPPQQQQMMPQLPQLPPSLPLDGKILARRTSTVVSESESDAEDQAMLPSFSSSTFQWDGPLASPSLQGYMRSQSFPKETFTNTEPDEDVENFFHSFDMMDADIHQQIEEMENDDDTAFGYLLEHAITD